MKTFLTLLFAIGLLKLEMTCAAERVVLLDRRVALVLGVVEEEETAAAIEGVDLCFFLGDVFLPPLPYSDFDVDVAAAAAATVEIPISTCKMSSFPVCSIVLANF